LLIIREGAACILRLQIGSEMPEPGDVSTGNDPNDRRAGISERGQEAKTG
jgi:hypothetical protein